MSSTPFIVTHIFIVLSAFPNGTSPSSIPIPISSSLGLNTASTLDSVITSYTLSSFATLALSGQSQQPSSAPQSTMAGTTVDDTVTPTSASPSVLLSTVPSTSATVASISSSAQSITSSDDGRSTTPTPETTVQTTTPSTIAPTTLESIWTSSSLVTSLLNKTTAPFTILSTAASPSNTPFSAVSHLPPDPSSQSSPAAINAPLTTVLASTTIFVTSTNSQGQVVTSIPPVVTEVITTTGSGGIAITVTQAVINPTLAPNNNTVGGESFFADTGAVVGVFVVVGLACASILMWILFAVRRRQRMSRIEQDTAVEAAVAAAGLNRAPLDDGDEDDSAATPNTHIFLPGMGQPISVRPSEDPTRDSTDSQLGYALEHRTSARPERYVPTRATSPSSRAEKSSRDRKSSYGHTPTYSAGSFEPLLANYAQNVPEHDAPIPGTEPPRSRSLQHLAGNSALNRHASNGCPEDGSTSSLKRKNSSDSSVLQKDEDYTRYVLMVRNLPDDQSQHSL